MRERRSTQWLAALLLCLLHPGCALFRPQHELPPLPLLPDRGAIVFVADGAGDFRGASNALRQAVKGAGFQLTVEPFVWSHGYLRVLADQLDETYARQEGKRLAVVLQAQRRLRPDVPIHLLGHSAGSAVVLAAAEEAHPDTIDSVVLLAPSAPENYDLRPALRNLRGNLHVFYSPLDLTYLRMSSILGSIIHFRLSPAAGSRGFRPIVRNEEDAACYAKLRQYPWQPQLRWTGNEGGHYGAYQQTFLRVFVLPLMTN